MIELENYSLEESKALEGDEGDMLYKYVGENGDIILLLGNKEVRGGEYFLGDMAYDLNTKSELFESAFNDIKNAAEFRELSEEMRVRFATILNKGNLH